MCISFVELHVELVCMNVGVGEIIGNHSLCELIAVSYTSAVWPPLIDPIRPLGKPVKRRPLTLRFVSVIYMLKITC